MKKIMISACITLMMFSPMFIQGFYAFKSQAQSASYQQARNEGLQSTATAAPTTDCSNCPCTCNTSNTSNYFIPPFNILLGNQNGTTINTHQFNVPNTFTLSNAILIVHIFPMSNSINNKTITYAAGSEGTYIIAYTLKDPAGSMVYKEYDQNLTLKNIPHQITLTSIPTTTQATTTTTTTPTTGTFSTMSTQPTGMTTAVAQSVFIPPLSITTYSLANRQQILNGISPLSQKFLLTIDNSGNITAIPISGTFDADNTTATTLALANNPLSSTTGSTGNAIGSIGIQFNDANLFSFDNTSQVQFTDSDLTQGLLLNIVVFPSSGGASYPVIATLRTSDGLKFRKKAALPTPTTGTATTDQPLSSMPTNITIQYTPKNGTSIPLLTTSFLNSGMTDNNNDAFTIISPLNLRFMIVRSATNKTNFNVIMM